MENVYVELRFSHKSFKTDKIAIVAVPNYCEYLTTYKKLAIEKVCKQLNLKEEEITIFDYKVLGEDVMFI